MLDVEKVFHLFESVPFADIRIYEAETSFIKIKNGEIEEVESGASTGYGIRVLYDGSFGFASSNDFSKLKEVFGKAVKLAKLSSKRSMNIKLSEEKTIVKEFKFKSVINLSDFSLEEKIPMVKEVNSLMKAEGLAAFSTVYHDSVFSKYYINSEGAELSFSGDYVSVFCSATAKQNDNRQSYSEVFAGLGGLEILNQAKEKAREVSATALSLLSAERVKPDKYTVVLGPKMTGTLCHEALGHACEADFIISGESILKGKLGEEIGSDEVTIYDDPSGKFNGSYPFDDEGVVSQKTVLVEKGVLKNYLHSRETAGKLETNSTGNARAESVYEFPLVRMSNVFFERGNFKLEELLEGRGVFIDGVKAGQTSTSQGTFQFTTEKGFYFENGEFKKPLRDVTFSGEILSVLKKIVGVGKDFDVSPGTCGKGSQQVRVSDGGPSLRLEGIRLA